MTLTMTTTKRFVSILLVALYVCLLGTMAFAQSGQSNTQSFTTKSITSENTNHSSGKIIQMNESQAKEISNGGLPNATIDDASNWAERKGFEIVGFLQTVVQPFAVIIFIGCGLMALVGAFGNGSLVGKGIVGMVIALIMYAVVLYAPELLDFFMAWVSS